MSPYKHKVVIEATREDGDLEEVYQRFTFEQFYDTNEAQVEEQGPLFKKIADAVEGHTMKARDMQFPETDFRDEQWFS